MCVSLLDRFYWLLNLWIEFRNLRSMKTHSFADDLFLSDLIRDWQTDINLLIFHFCNLLSSFNETWNCKEMFEIFPNISRIIVHWGKTIGLRDVHEESNSRIAQFKTPLHMRFKCKGSLWNAWPSYTQRNRYVITIYLVQTAIHEVHWLTQMFWTRKEPTSIAKMTVSYSENSCGFVWQYLFLRHYHFIPDTYN